MDPFLLNLAPTNLVNRRSDRYDGSGYSVSLHEFAETDVSIIKTIYQQINQIYQRWLTIRNRTDISSIQQLIIDLNQSDFIDIAQKMGQETYKQRPDDPAIRKIIHDIKGGCLNSLIGYAHLLSKQPTNDLFIRKAVFLARDHGKMMRNALVDIDPDQRQLDEQAKIHSIQDYVEKLQDCIYGNQDKPIQILIQCIYEGHISNRCMETSAIDRILYNYINNAARFAADSTVSVFIFPINDQFIRWVIVNSIDREQANWLADQFNSDLSPLFQEGITKGGHGIGLSTCADFISSCFGIHPPQKAVKEGYLGATVYNQHFYGWFHWPPYIENSAKEKELEL